MVATRIDARQANQDVEADALLVCAYDDPEKWEHYRVEEAISLHELRRREPSLEKDRELIFYCA